MALKIIQTKVSLKVKLQQGQLHREVVDFLLDRLLDHQVVDPLLGDPHLQPLLAVLHLLAQLVVLLLQEFQTMQVVPR